MPFGPLLRGRNSLHPVATWMQQKMINRPHSPMRPAVCPLPVCRSLYRRFRGRSERSYFVTISHEIEAPGNLDIENLSVEGRPPAGNRFIGSGQKYRVRVSRHRLVDVRAISRRLDDAVRRRDPQYSIPPIDIRRKIKYLRAVLHCQPIRPIKISSYNPGRGRAFGIMR